MDIRDRWINLLHRAATGTKKTRTLLTPIGMAIFGVFTSSVAVVKWPQLARRSTVDCHRCWRGSMVSVPFSEGEGNTCTLQPSTNTRDDRSLPICQKSNAYGGLSPPFWNWFCHKVTLTCRFIHSTLYIGKCMGAQRNRGAGASEAIGKRLCCLSTANPDVHT